MFRLFVKYLSLPNNSGGPGLSFQEYQQKYPGLSHSVNSTDAAAISSRTSSSSRSCSSSTVVNNSLHNSMNNSSTRKTTLCSNSTSNQRVFESISSGTSTMSSTPTSKQVDLLQQHGNRNLRHIDSSISTTEAAEHKYESRSTSMSEMKHTRYGIIQIMNLDVGIVTLFCQKHFEQFRNSFKSCVYFLTYFKSEVFSILNLILERQ